MFVMLCALQASAYDFMEGGFAYNINEDDTTLTVTYISSDNSEYVFEVYNGIHKRGIVPSTVTHEGKTYTVTAVGERAFAKTEVDIIYLPPTITKLEKEAFYRSLVYDVFFKNCQIEEIGERAFAECSNYAIPSFPATLTTIGAGAFVGCRSMTGAYLTGAITTVGTGAFSNCFELYSLFIGENVETIGEGAFAGCVKLFNVTIPNTVKSIGKDAFTGCVQLNKLAVGDENATDNHRTTIGEGAFSNCTALTSLTLGNSVVAIGRGAFKESPFSAIVIPASVEELQPGAFNSSALRSISVEAGNNRYDSRDNCNAVMETATATLVVGCPKTTIPDTTKIIGEEAFAGIRSLTSVNLPQGVTTVGRRAYYLCSQLSSVTLPKSVTLVDEEAFYLSYGYRLTIQSDITVNGTKAFATLGLSSDESGVKELVILDGVTKLGSLWANPTTIDCYCLVPPQCVEQTFSGYTATLHVPQPSIRDYFTAPYWENFVIENDIATPSSITLDKNELTLYVGNTSTLHATTVPTNVYGWDIQWYSTNPAVATVNSGVVTAIALGEADVVVTCGDVSDTCHVFVVEQPVVITFDIQTARMKINDLLTISITITPETAIQLALENSDPEVALAQLKNGKVQVLANKQGKTTITVSAVDGSARPAVCVVTVCGDVNGDGIVSGADVTALYNVLLDGATVDGDADVNEDGIVNGSDVTALYNLLLN